MNYLFDLTPQEVSIPATGDGLLQGFAESAGPRLDAYRAARVDENRWRDTLNAFSDMPSGLSRAQMFALGRDPAMRPFAVELLTGRMNLEQLLSSAASPHAPVPLPRPRSNAQPPAFVPSRMAIDADFQATSGGAYSSPYGLRWPR